jgi:hypothetical protein
MSVYDRTRTGAWPGRGGERAGRGCRRLAFAVAGLLAAPGAEPRR